MRSKSPRDVRAAQSESRCLRNRRSARPRRRRAWRACTARARVRASKRLAQVWAKGPALASSPTRATPLHSGSARWVARAQAAFPAQDWLESKARRRRPRRLRCPTQPSLRVAARDGGGSGAARARWQARVWPRWVRRCASSARARARQVRPNALGAAAETALARCAALGTNAAPANCAGLATCGAPASCAAVVRGLKDRQSRFGSRKLLARTQTAQRLIELFTSDAQARTHGAGWHIEQVRDFRHGHLFQLVQHEDRTLLELHGRQNLVQVTPGVRKLRESLRARLAPLAIGKRVILTEPGVGVFTPSFQTATASGCDAQGRRKQKALLALSCNRVQLATRDDEYFLCGVIRVSRGQPQPAEAAPNKVEMRRHQRADPSFRGAFSDPGLRARAEEWQA